jgi:translation initiation factor 5A
MSPIEASHIKKGMYIILQGRPCKIVNISFSKTGKHGHMKAAMTGIDVINSSKHMVSIPGHNSLTQFEIQKNIYTLVNIEEDTNTIECLNSDNNLVTIILQVTEEFTKLKEVFDTEKQFTLTIIRAPVEKSADNFVDERCIESFVEESNA